MNIILLVIILNFVSQSISPMPIFSKNGVILFFTSHLTKDIFHISFTPLPVKIHINGIAMVSVSCMSCSTINSATTIINIIINIILTKGAIIFFIIETYLGSPGKNIQCVNVGLDEGVIHISVL